MIYHIVPSGDNTSIHKISSACIAASGEKYEIIKNNNFFKLIIDVILLNFKINEKATIVHVHYPIGIMVSSFFLWRGRLVISIHDEGYKLFSLYLNKFLSIIMIYMIYMAIWKSNVVIFPSKSTLKNYPKKFINKYKVINNFSNYLMPLHNLDNGDINFSEIFILADKRLYVKGVDYLFNIPNEIKVNIYGVNEVDIKKYFNLGYLPKNITAHGFSKSELIYKKVIEAKGIVIITSRTEGMPLVSLECLLNSIPLVVNALEVFDEYLPEFYFPRFKSSDIDSILNALKKCSKISITERNFIANSSREKYNFISYVSSVRENVYNGGIN